MPGTSKGCDARTILVASIVAVATIVAMVYSYGVASAALGEVLGAIVAGAAAGAYGSIVGQAMSVGLGLQKDFSWREVAMAGIGGAVSSGVGAGLSGLGAAEGFAGQLVSVGMRAGIADMVNQGVGLVFQPEGSGFSWEHVAAAAVSGGVGAGVSNATSAVLGNSGENYSFWKGLIGNVASSGSSAAMTMAALGGRVDRTDIVGDAFGNALGQSIAEKVTSAGNAASRAEAELEQIRNEYNAIGNAEIAPNSLSLSNNFGKNAIAIDEQIGLSGNPDEMTSGEFFSRYAIASNSKNLSDMPRVPYNREDEMNPIVGWEDGTPIKAPLEIIEFSDEEVIGNRGTQNSSEAKRPSTDFNTQEADTWLGKQINNSVEKFEAGYDKNRAETLASFENSAGIAGKIAGELMFAKQDFELGFSLAAYESVAGTLSLASNIAHLTSWQDWVADPSYNIERVKGAVTAADTLGKLASPVEWLTNFDSNAEKGTLLFNAATEKYQNDIRSGNYGKLAGRLEFNAGTLVLGGIEAEAAKVGSEAAQAWKLGSFKSAAKWEGQLAKRGWTPRQITEAIQKGEKFAAENLVNKGNAATRYVHPETGQSVVLDEVTKEVIHVGGPGFAY